MTGAGFSTRRASDVVCLASGASVPLAFAPFDLHLVAIPALSMLFFLWQHVTPRRALWLGWVFGLGMFGVGASWIQVSVHNFGLPVFAFSVSVTAAFVAYIALYPAVFGYFWCRLLRGRPYGALGLCALAAAWTLSEWLRGWLYLGFPWLSLGYSQIDTVLSGFAPLGGVFAVSAAVSASAAALVAALAWRGWARGGAIALLAVVWVAAFALSQVAWTQNAGPPLSIALIQGNVPQEIKWDEEQRAPTLALYSELSAPHWRRDLIVWPETAVPAFPSGVTAFLQRLDEQAKHSQTAMLVGIPDSNPDTGNYFNTLIALGTARGSYRKVHLVPFGEYLPMATLLDPILDVLNVHVSRFSSGGKGQPLIKVGDYRLASSICYEDAFGEELIAALPDAAWLVNVSNDAWFGDSLAPHQHLQIAQMRALEAGRQMLRATNTGISAIIDERGRIRARSAQFAVQVLSGELQPREGSTPYVVVGNYGIVVVALLVVVFGFARRRRTCN